MSGDEGAGRTTRIESGSLGKGRSASEPGNAGDGKGKGGDAVQGTGGKGGQGGAGSDDAATRPRATAKCSGKGAKHRPLSVNEQAGIVNVVSPALLAQQRDPACWLDASLWAMVDFSLDEAAAHARRGGPLPVLGRGLRRE